MKWLKTFLKWLFIIFLLEMFLTLITLMYMKYYDIDYMKAEGDLTLGLPFWVVLLLFLIPVVIYHLWKWWKERKGGSPKGGG